MPHNLCEMNCPRCGKENEPAAKYCSRCGIEMATVKQPEPPTEADALPCYRHKKELTRLSCGRCGKPVCHRCAINGPAGIRCPECGKMDIPFNARGTLFGIKRQFTGLFGRSPYMIYIVVLIAMSLFGTFRSCGNQPRDQYPEDSREYDSGPENPLK